MNLVINELREMARWLICGSRLQWKLAAHEMSLSWYGLHVELAVCLQLEALVMGACYYEHLIWQENIYFRRLRILFFLPWTTRVSVDST